MRQSQPTRDSLQAFRDRHYDFVTFDLVLVLVALIASALIVGVAR